MNDIEKAIEILDNTEDQIGGYDAYFNDKDEMEAVCQLAIKSLKAQDARDKGYKVCNNLGEHTRISQRRAK